MGFGIGQWSPQVDSGLFWLGPPILPGRINWNPWNISNRHCGRTVLCSLQASKTFKTSCQQEFPWKISFQIFQIFLDPIPPIKCKTHQIWPTFSWKPFFFNIYFLFFQKKIFFSCLESQFGTQMAKNYLFQTSFHFVWLEYNEVNQYVWLDAFPKEINDLWKVL